MAQAVIHAKKVLYNGNPMFEIVGFENVLTKDQLPIKYYYGTSGYWFYSDNSNTMLRCSHKPDVAIGTKLSTTDFDNYIRYLKICGTRLTECKQAEAKLKPKWNGQEVTVKI